MIHVLHGFLGSPADFAFLKNDNVKIYDLIDENFHIELGPEDTLIGYSMGGRIALELASGCDFKLKKLVLINAHPGLSSDEERQARNQWEDQVQAKLNQMNAKDFFDYWNSLPIFQNDQKLPVISEERYQGFKKIFDRYRLSNQKNYLDIVSNHLDKVLWIIGLLDEKYTQMAEDLLLPRDIPIKGLMAGHRIFQSPADLMNLLKEENVL